MRVGVAGRLHFKLQGKAGALVLLKTFHLLSGAGLAT